VPVGVENLAFVATKREVFTDKVALSKQVCLVFPDAAFPYYTPPPPIERACYPPSGHALGSSVD